MNNTNICWECRHSQLKLKKLVPRNSTIKKYINKTSGLQSEIVAINKEKQGIYNVWFRLGGVSDYLVSKCSIFCKLKKGQEKTEKMAACENCTLKKTKTQSTTWCTANNH